MEYTYKPEGVCSEQFSFQVEDGIITAFEIKGGCAGNANGIASLLVGMPVAHVIARFEGAPCRTRGTSCPDQIARALQSVLAGEQ